MYKLLFVNFLIFDFRNKKIIVENYLIASNIFQAIVPKKLKDLVCFILIEKIINFFSLVHLFVSLIPLEFWIFDRKLI